MSSNGIKPDNETTSEYPMLRYQSEKSGVSPQLHDTIVNEICVEVDVNDGEFTRTVNALPRDLDALGVGVLLGDSNLRPQRPEDIFSIRTPPDAEKILIRGNFTPAEPKQTPQLLTGEVSVDYLFKLAEDFQNRCNLWGKTGCVHATALCDTNLPLLFVEDVARYNAFDKLIGRAFLENIDLIDKFLIMMGRLTGGIVRRAAAAGLGMLVSRSAVTSLSIDLAKKYNITIVGFLRGNRMNVYTQGLWRITGSP